MALIGSITIDIQSLLPMGLGLTECVVLSGAAILTSALSAIVGMAGGITLLAIMLLFVDPLVAIPLHGVVQLISNGSRAFVQRKHVKLSLVWPYVLGLLPLGYFGLLLAEELPPNAGRLLIGSFVLVATWRPQWLLMGRHPESINSRLRFVLLGLVVGFLNVTVGATGPLIAPFFLDLGLNRFALIGTKATFQVAGHAVKILIFGIAGFVYSDWLGLLLALSICVVGGTLLGTRMLKGVSEVVFLRLYKGVLTAVALSLVFRFAISA